MTGKATLAFPRWSVRLNLPAAARMFPIPLSA